MSGRALAMTGLGLGVPVLGLVAALLARTLEPVREIHAYAGAIGAAVDGIARNLDAGTELARTRELATAVPALAGTLLEGGA